MFFSILIPLSALAIFSKNELKKMLGSGLNIDIQAIVAFKSK